MFKSLLLLFEGTGNSKLRSFLLVCLVYPFVMGLWLILSFRNVFRLKKLMKERVYRKMVEDVRDEIKLEKSSVENEIGIINEERIKAMFLMEEIVGFLSVENFEGVDEILKRNAKKIETLSNREIIGLLRSTNMVRDRLVEWESFYELGWNEIERRGKSPNDLLVGLKKEKFLKDTKSKEDVDVHNVARYDMIKSEGHKVSDSGDKQILDVKNKVRIIFLDFDGVLHAVSRRGLTKEFVWLPILNELIADFSDVKIVVHASARFNMSSDFILKRLGIGEDRYFGVTDKKFDREESILNWVNENAENIKSYIILDDNIAEFDVLKGDLIVCKSNDGLSDDVVQEKIEDWLILSGKN